MKKPSDRIKPGFNPQDTIKSKKAEIYEAASLKIPDKELNIMTEEPAIPASGTCSCNSVCSCVPVSGCACDTVCTCDSVCSSNSCTCNPFTGCSGHTCSCQPHSGGGGGGCTHWVYYG